MSNHKIIFLGSLPPPYMGPSVATQILLKSFLKDDFDLIHLDTSDRRDLNTIGAIDFQNIYLALKHYVTLTWLILKKRPAMVYIPITQTTIGYIRDSGFILISKLFSKKVICHLRGGNFKNWYTSANPFTRWLVRRVHSLVDGQIVLGQSLRNLFSGLMPEDKIFVVPNGGNYENHLCGLEKTHKPRVLYLANFIKTKGVMETVKAAPDVFDVHPDVAFVFAGNWIDESTRIEFKAFLNQHPHLPVILRGPVHGKEKYALLASSDVFVFPTYYPPEGHPWVIVEAMAAGLPVISTDQGAIAESVIHGRNGYIVEKRNPEAIAEKINLLIEQPELRKAMGAESRKMYLKNFTEDRMVERLSAVFDRVLSN